jgi:chorismate lyase / 3-hydroxybenzoate synthase
VIGVQRLRAPAGLHLAYVSRAEEAPGWDDVLGIATFSGSPLLSAAAGVPVAQVNTPILAASAHQYEIWSSGRPAESGQHGRVRFRRTPEMLFGCIALPERDFGGGTGPAGGPTSALHRATEEAYQEICATLEAEGYPHLLRVWNYLADINRDSGGTERYRQFNTARQHALHTCGRAVAGSVPAASALGARSESPLVVYFLAGRVAPLFVENPRQVSAYNYPSEYGTHSPVFSRAALLRQSGSVTLFISGTASIVGHQSLHPGDTAAQTRETLTNIEALVGEANRRAGDAHFDLDTLAYKVYVRRPADLPVIQAQLHSRIGAQAQMLYLQADICRQDLLVEIEATGICALAAAA